MPSPAVQSLTAVTACAALAAVTGWAVSVFARVPEVAWPETVEIEIWGRIVSAREGTVAARRHGRVLRPLRALGDEVAAGDALIEFDDLALFGSRADLKREIEHRRGALAEESERRLPVQSESSRLRSAALHHMERSYEMALEEFERWKILKAEGLVARVDFEKKQAEFAAVTRRLEEVRAAAREAAPAPDEQSGEPEAPGLRRAERLLVRLNDLPDTFLVRSPWNGSVRAIHVGEGDIPDRGAPLVTIARTAMGRVEAEVGRDLRVVEVRSACGVPGPLPFDLRDGTLSLMSPSPRMELGQRCRLAVVVRSRHGEKGN